MKGPKKGLKLAFLDCFWLYSFMGFEAKKRDVVDVVEWTPLDCCDNYSQKLMIKDELQSWLKLEIANTNPRSTQLESSAPGCEVSPARSRRLTMSLKHISG